MKEIYLTKPDDIVDQLLQRAVIELKESDWICQLLNRKPGSRVEVHNLLPTDDLKRSFILSQWLEYFGYLKRCYYFKENKPIGRIKKYYNHYSKIPSKIIVQEHFACVPLHRKNDLEEFFIINKLDFPFMKIPKFHILNTTTLPPSLIVYFNNILANSFDGISGFFPRELALRDACTYGIELLPSLDNLAKRKVINSVHLTFCSCGNLIDTANINKRIGHCNSCSLIAPISDFQTEHYYMIINIDIETKGA